MIPVIMAGGTGSRLWPMSRELYPKQFLTLSDDESMLQSTITRLYGLDIVSPIIICNEQHRFLAAEQLRGIGVLANSIILEPIGRNTAPAIALAALKAMANGDDPLLLILAADHVIDKKKEFHKVIEQAKYHALKGKLVTFGIVANVPETGYGYIQRGSSLNKKNDSFEVKRFVEKPDLKTANDYVSSGEYYWNSGMFLFKASRYLEELEKFRPDILNACIKSMGKIKKDENQDFTRVDKDEFYSCPDESIDYAVMEKTKDAIVLPLDAGWSDVGSWSALWQINKKNEENNYIYGDVFSYNTTGCYINTDGTFVSAIGVSNLVIVSTKDSLLVVDKSQVQDVKKTVEFLKYTGRSEYKNHRELYRPWGKQDRIIDTDKYQINRVTVKPGGRFSLQQHIHRSEHWIVLTGTAKVTLDGGELYLTENQSTIVPPGSSHTLENPGEINLEILEIASGDYLGEDDIIRLKDFYGDF